MLRRIDLLLASILLASGACSSPTLEDHPEHERVEAEVERTVKEVRNEEGLVLYQLLQRLVAYDVFAVDAVAELARDPNARLRSNAVWVLSQINDPGYPREQARIEKILRNALEDPDRFVRLEAASGLLIRNHWDVIPLLVDGLEDPDPNIRHNCSEVLRTTTSRNFGFSVDGPEAERQVAAQRWREWYEEWRKSEG